MKIEIRIDEVKDGFKITGKADPGGDLGERYASTSRQVGNRVKDMIHPVFEVIGANEAKS